MRHALVTGGAGFIGSELVRRLQRQDWKTRVLDDLSTGRIDNLPSGVELLRGDIRDAVTCRAACAGVSHVFHLAARVTVRQSLAEFYADADVNLMGTLSLLRAAGAAGVRRLLFASSMAVYADSPPGTRIGEDHPTRPLSPYGISKLAAESYIRLVAPTLGIDPVILRLFNTYGPGQAFTPYVGVLTIFITRLLKGESCVIHGDGSQRRDFVHRDDVAAAFERAAVEPAVAGGTFNIGTGLGTSVIELAERVRTELGGGRIERGAALAVELRHSVAQIERARAAFGYRPTHNLEGDLPDLIDYLRRRLATQPREGGVEA